ncbi:hypothetical protein [Candidatus Hodarchaeum mangrovi]
MTEVELNKEYEKWIDIIDNQLKVFNHVSCQRIFIYLRISGKKTATDLMSYLKYSRGAIYTALNYLLEAQYIKKEEDPNIQDKRKNVFYYAIDKDFKIIGDTNFVNYVIKRDKLNLYLKWLKKSVIMSTSMIDEIYDMVIDSKISKIKEAENLESTRLPLDSDIKKSIVTYSVLGSVNNHKETIEKILTFLTKLEHDFVISESSKKPISNPTLFSLYYIPF